MKRIIIIGSRRRNKLNDYAAILSEFFDIYARGDIIVSGGCREGGDNFAERISAIYNVPMVIWPAKWKVNGIYIRAAGFIRNTIIAQNGDILIACVASDRKGGTEDTIKKFKKLKPEAEVILC